MLLLFESSISADLDDALYWNWLSCISIFGESTPSKLYSSSLAPLEVFLYLLDGGPPPEASFRELGLEELLLVSPPLLALTSCIKATSRLLM